MSVIVWSFWLSLPYESRPGYPDNEPEMRELLRDTENSPLE